MCLSTVGGGGGDLGDPLTQAKPPTDPKNQKISLLENIKF